MNLRRSDDDNDYLFAGTLNADDSFVKACGITTQRTSTLPCDKKEKTVSAGDSRAARGTVAELKKKKKKPTKGRERRKGRDRRRRRGRGMTDGGGNGEAVWGCEISDEGWFSRRGGPQLLPDGECREQRWGVGWVNRRCSISPRSFHARMETGCGGLHVLLRAPASSCKGAVDDYNATSYVVDGYTITMQAEKPISTPQPKQVRIDELAVYVVNVVIEKLTAVLEI
ncbi:hypothetical protein G5I_11872 [Acromyrmex echinatior]|uniref:Uncharacterized protein n=1 Tax=Acromyrmex echinatior TaxID=103372 RepID=F4X0S5_ACREC|nr:hypothetical protein G5I_11872 [Acromyrmex echinatior]